MKRLPTLPPVLADDSSPSSTERPTGLLRRLTLPVDGDLEVADPLDVAMMRPGSRVDLPFPGESEDELPLPFKSNLPQNVEPLPVPLDF